MTTLPFDEILPVAKREDKPALIDGDAYAAMYQQSIENPEAFWSAQAQRFLDWATPFSSVKNTRFSPNVHIEWFGGGELNVCYNCVDRHLPKRANQTAIIWEADTPGKAQHITYTQLFDEVCRFASILKQLGVKRGDVVTIYLPMIPEAAYAMLACARIGAIHSVVFGGFSPEALRSRIEDGKSTLLITADQGMRGGKPIPLQKNAEAAIEPLTGVDLLIVETTTTPHGHHSYNELKQTVQISTDYAVMESESPLFILYTSGSTGKPKGVLHTSAGYLLYAALTQKYVFDVQEGDIYWCTADVGWVTGHSYIVYGPLANGGTTLMFEGVPTYPDASRFWQVIDTHKVNIFYTAPTAIRALMAMGDDFVTRTSRATLRVLGSVGEPINPEAWRWYHSVVGNGKCPIVDTWWQTETGGHLITPLTYATPLKPGSATRPFFGVQPVLMDEKGHVVHGEGQGALCIADSWPGQMRSVYGDHARFEQTYFAQYKGYYFSGDGAIRDKDGYYWITGRIDDVLNISGHRIGTAEVEGALVGHAHVAEAAVVGYPHDIKGQGIYAFVMLNDGVQADEALIKALKDEVRKTIGGLAVPDYIQVAPSLPKTRSGKIMRRILRKIAENDFGNLGETSTLLNPDVVEVLIQQRLNKVPAA